MEYGKAKEVKLKDSRKRKERKLIERSIIKREKGYVLNPLKSKEQYAGKWNCLCKYGIPGHAKVIRIPHPLCVAHSKTNIRL